MTVPGDDDREDEAETQTDATGASGRRIAELLASELTARDDGPLAGLVLTDVDRDVEPDEFGALAYRVALGEDPEGADEHIADCFVHEDRVRVEFVAALDLFPECAREAGLRVRPKALDPPRALVFVEDAAQVKRVLPVVGSVADALRDQDDEAGEKGDA